MNFQPQFHSEGNFNTAIVSNNENFTKRNDKLSKNSSNVFTLAILIGVISMAITTSLPGRLDGGFSFIIGFSISFIALGTFVVVSTTRNKKPKTLISKESDSTFFCPVCESRLTLTLTRAPDHRHTSKEDANE